MHQCSDEEFERFHPIEDESRAAVAKIRAAGKFKCFDWQKEDMDVYGNWRSDANWFGFEIGLYPCATRLDLYDGRI